MSQKQKNQCIRCGVESCSFHCDSENYCSLPAIQVAPCPGCCDGAAEDESMCASYKHR